MTLPSGKSSQGAKKRLSLRKASFAILLRLDAAGGEILFDHYMAMNPGYVEEEITGIPTFEPSFHLPAIWITESQRERAESMGYTVVDPPSIMATHLTEVIRQHIAELLTRQDVQNLINNIKDNTTMTVEGIDIGYLSENEDLGEKLFSWDNWEQAVYKPHLRKSYYMLQEYLKDN